MYAELPHRFDSVLWVGHTVPNGDPPEPYAAGTALCGAILSAPFLTPETFVELPVGERRVSFLAVVPLHADEMELKLNRGADALFDRLDGADITEALAVSRPSATARRRRFGRR